MTRFATLKEIKAKTWAGDHAGPDGAAALHQYRFSKTPKGPRRDRELVPYAVTLYSARKDVDVTRLYEPLVPKLIDRISPAFYEKNADALDVISTHLAWWAQLQRAKLSMLQIRAKFAAEEACLLGFELTESEPLGEHTRTLLLLTYVDLQILHGRWKFALPYLFEATGRARHITDPNHRARAYRKLAYIWCLRLKLFGFVPDPFGLWFLFRARTVPGIAADVKSKNRL